MEKGNCFVETKSLDGETNLKSKQAEKKLHEKFSDKGKQKIDQLLSIDGNITCENPNNQIYKFEGRILIDNNEIPLGIENVLLRGCKLMNTESVIGVSIFTGSETKVMKNSAKAKFKFSKLERLTNKFILCILGLQVILASIGGLVGSGWIVKNRDVVNYITIDKDLGHFMLFIQTTGTWILIFTNFVPISLMVTVELVKFWQAIFMTYDYMMVDLEQQMQMRA